MKKVIKFVTVLLTAVATAKAAIVSVATVDSKPFVLDLRRQPREAAAVEKLTYGAGWSGESDGSVTIKADGEVIASGLSGEGTVDWTTPKNKGVVEVTHETIVSGSVVNTLSATFDTGGLDISDPVNGFGLKIDGGPFVYSGYAQTPTVSLTNATTTASMADFDVEYSNNTNAGIATVTVTGKGGLFGTFTGLFEIAPRAVTLTSASGSWVYDGAAHSAPSVTADGFVAGEGASYSDFATITAAGTVANTFSYTLSAGTLAGNYTITKSTGTLTVTKSSTIPTDIVPETPIDPDDPSDPNASNRVSVYDYFGTYDGVVHTIDTNALSTAATKFGAGAVVTFATTENGEYTATAPAWKDAGTNEVWYCIASQNYVDYKHKAIVAIAPREVTLTSASGSWVYDGAAHSAPSVTADGFVAGEGASYSDFATITAAGTVANTFSYTLSAGTLAGNYTITKSTGTLTVTKSSTIPTDIVPETPIDPDDPSDPNAQSRVSVYDYFGTYDGMAHTIDTNALSTAATKFGAGAVVTFATTEDGQYTATAPAWKDAGTNEVWYCISSQNYTNYKHKSIVAIAPREVTLTSASDSWVYDGAAHSAPSVTADGFVAGEGAICSDFATITAASTVANTFNYTLSAGTLAGNYTITKSTGTLTVTSKAFGGGSGGSGSDFRVEVSEDMFVYDGTAHTPVVSVFDGNKALAQGSDYTVSYSGNIHAGTATISVTGKGNYAGSLSGSFTIAPRPLTLSAASKDKPYDGFPLAVTAADITASGSGYAPGECLAYSGFASITDVGETSATFTYADSDTARVSDYEITVTPGKILTVTVGADQISVTADSGTWAYDGLAHSLSTWTTVNEDKLLAGDVLEVQISSQCTITEPGTIANTFEAVKIIREATGADVTRNYNLFTYEGTLTVTNATINITDSFDITKVYDGSPTGIVVKAYSLLQPATIRYAIGEAPFAVDLEETPLFTHTGQYTVWYTIEAPFYEPYTNKASVAIARRPLSLTSPTKSKAYDGEPLTFGSSEIAVDGLVEGEVLALDNFATITDAGRTTATFAVEAGEGTDLADYELTITEGTLTVLASAEEITITADSATWVYDGKAHTATTYTVGNESVLQSGDALEVVFDPHSCVTTPDDGTVANTITSVKVVRNGAEDVTRNYTLSWYPGELKVINATMSADASTYSTSATYDGMGHSIEVVPPALLTAPVTVLYATEAAGPYTSTLPQYVNAGTYTTYFTISAKYYDPYKGSATVTVEPRTVTLVSDSATKVYDGSVLRSESVSIKDGSLDFVDGDTYTAHTFASITDVGGTENTFSYTLTGNSRAENYTIRKEYGSLRVTPSPMNLAGVAKSYTGVYDGAAHTIAVNSPFPGAVVTYALESGNEEAYTATAPTWRDVTAPQTVYYKVKAPNYNPGYGSATVEVQPRPLTLTSASGTWFYDGAAHSEAKVVADGLVAGDKLTYSDFATITEVDTTANTFSYSFGAGTLATNYSVTVINGTLTINDTATPIAMVWSGAPATNNWDEIPFFATFVQDSPAKAGEMVAESIIRGFSADGIAIENGSLIEDSWGTTNWVSTASDGTTWTNLVYTWSVAPLRDGAVNVRVKEGAAQDSAGNLCAESAVATVWSDRTAPSLTASAATPAVRAAGEHAWRTSEQIVQLRLEATDTATPLSVAYALGEEEFSDWISGLDFATPTLEEGTNHLHVALMDAVGNISSPTDICIVADRTAPELALAVASQSASIAPQIIAIATDADPILEYSWSLDGAQQSDWTTFDGTATLRPRGAAPGAHTATVSVRDRVGNSSTRSIELAVAASAALPTLSIEPVATGVVNGREPFAFLITLGGASWGDFDEDMIRVESTEGLIYRYALDKDTGILTLYPESAPGELASDTVEVTLPAGIVVNSDGTMNEKASASQALYFAQGTPRASIEIIPGGFRKEESHWRLTFDEGCDLSTLPQIEITGDKPARITKSTRQSGRVWILDVEESGAPIASHEMRFTFKAGAFTNTDGVSNEAFTLSAITEARLLMLTEAVTTSNGTVTDVRAVTNGDTTDSTLVQNINYNLPVLSKANAVWIKTVDDIRKGVTTYVEVSPDTKIANTDKVAPHTIDYFYDSTDDIYKIPLGGMNAMRARFRFAQTNYVNGSLVNTYKQKRIAEITLNGFSTTNNAPTALVESVTPLDSPVQEPQSAQARFSVRFRRAVAAYDTTKITPLPKAGVKTGTASVQLATDGMSAVISVPVSGQGTLGLRLAIGAFTDTYGFGNSALTLRDVYRFAKNPKLQPLNVLSFEPSIVAETARDELEWRLVFSAPVENLTLGAFALDTRLQRLLSVRDADHGGTNYLVRAQALPWTGREEGISLTLRAGLVSSIDGAVVATDVASAPYTLLPAEIEALPPSAEGEPETENTATVPQDAPTQPTLPPAPALPPPYTSEVVSADWPATWTESELFDDPSVVEVFAQWASANGITTEECTANPEIEKWFLMNADPTQPLPEPEICSIALEVDGTLRIETSHGPADVNGVIELLTTDTLGGEWETSGVDFSSGHSLEIDPDAKSGFYRLIVHPSKTTR